MIKKVVHALYAHKSNLEELLANIPEEERDIVKRLVGAAQNVPYAFDIIKYDRGNITLISSPDWDTANEPIVGEVRLWKVDNRFDADGKLLPPTRSTTNFKQIYHNKWMFVTDDYAGFDIEAAKERTKLWNAIPNLNKSKIGSKVYWLKLLAENGISE